MAEDAVPICDACGRPDEKPVHALAPRVLLCRACGVLSLTDLIDRLFDRGVDVHSLMPVLID